jgi:hypothetical protein
MSQPEIPVNGLLPFQPDRCCPKCNNEVQVEVTFHQAATLQHPCWADEPANRIWTPHLCRRCAGCGFAWCEQTADAYPAGEAPAGEAAP